jgi:hypothetical protein
LVKSPLRSFLLVRHFGSLKALSVPRFGNSGSFFHGIKLKLSRQPFRLPTLLEHPFNAQMEIQFLPIRDRLLGSIRQSWSILRPSFQATRPRVESKTSLLLYN